MSYLKEKANCLRNEMNHLWGAMFITGGGAIGFTTLAEKSILIFVYIYVGLFLTIIFFNAYMVRRNQLLEVTESLRKQGDKDGTDIRCIN